MFIGGQNIEKIHSNLDRNYNIKEYYTRLDDILCI